LRKISKTQQNKTEQKKQISETEHDVKIFRTGLSTLKSPVGAPLG